MKKFSKFIKESIPLRIKSSANQMYVMIIGEDVDLINEWYEKNLSGMMSISTTETGGDSKVLKGISEEHEKIEASFRTGNTVIHLCHGADTKAIEKSMSDAKARGLTTALISLGDVNVDSRLVDINYKI